MFANTTSTGQANALAAGNQPDGTTPSSATYGDATAYGVIVLEVIHPHQEITVIPSQ